MTDHTTIVPQDAPEPERQGRKMNMSDLRVLTRIEALRVLGLSARTWARLEAKGKTPPKIRLSEGRVGYAARDLWQWIEARREASPVLPQKTMGKQYGA